MGNIFGVQVYDSITYEYFCMAYIEFMLNNEKSIGFTHQTS